MLVFYIFFSLLIIISSKINSSNEYLAQEKTTIIKGIFIVLVFFSHFNSYVIYENKLDIIYQNIINFFGQAMVAPFLFYSGYGIMEQIKKKGQEYIKKIPIKRILITCIKFDLAVLLFYIIKIINNNKVSIKQLLLSFIGWDTLGNSNWYIFTILILYLITYLGFIITKNKKINLLTITILTCIYIIVLYYFKLKPSFWFDTAPCYLLGIYYSNYKEKIYQKINYNTITYTITLIATILGCLVLKKYSHHISISILFNLLFSLLIVIITMKLSIKNKIFSWCGNHLFELYILQRIPMIIFSQTKIINNIYLYFVICLIITTLIVLIFKKITDKIISKIIVISK